MATEAPANGVSTTLSGSITNTATTCSLTSATGFTNAQYHVLLSDGTNYEIALGTALSGTTLTMTRAVESYAGVTAAYAFASGSSITIVPSVASVQALINQATGAVTSVFTRTGAVVAASGDYTVAQVTGAAPLASPALTGTPTAVTNGTITDSSLQIATDQFVQNALNAAAVGGPSVFTATGTWTPATTGQAIFRAFVVGGGGGGAAGSTTYGGAGGGGGEVNEIYLGNVVGTQTVTIGAGGAAGSNGGATTIGSLATGAGGLAGSTTVGGYGGSNPHGASSSPGNGGTGSTTLAGTPGYAGFNRYGAGGGAGGYLATSGGGGGGAAGAAGGAGVTGAGGGGGAGDTGTAGGAGSSTTGGAGGAGAANKGSGGGGGGAGTTPGAGGAGGSGYVVIWQVA